MARHIYATFQYREGQGWGKGPKPKTAKWYCVICWSVFEKKRGNGDCSGLVARPSEYAQRRGGPMRDETQDDPTVCPKCKKQVPWSDNPSNPVNWPQWGGHGVKHECSVDTRISKPSQDAE